MDDVEHDPDLDPIPEKFHCFETGRPFTNCLVCKRFLLRRNTEHLIQKSYFSGEVVLELAICTECNEQSIMSQESEKRLAAFMAKHTGTTGRNADLYASLHQLEPWISHCLTCKQAREKTNEYTLIAVCDGPDIVYWDTPFMFCGNCVAAMQECLSESTRDMWNEWVETNLDCPPEMKRVLEKGGPIFA